MVSQPFYNTNIYIFKKVWPENDRTLIWFQKPVITITPHGHFTSFVFNSFVNHFYLYFIDLAWAFTWPFNFLHISVITSIFFYQFVVFFPFRMIFYFYKWPCCTYCMCGEPQTLSQWPHSMDGRQTDNHVCVLKILTYLYSHFYLRFSMLSNIFICFFAYKTKDIF